MIKINRKMEESETHNQSKRNPINILQVLPSVYSKEATYTVFFIHQHPPM